jgi:Tol biopolymer transport system component/imidazolonepropionase-like amidohydrolase
LPPPTGSDDGLIAFYSHRDGNVEIYTMRPDGSDQRRLTFNEYDDYSPAWSPDGSRIAFLSDRDDPNPTRCGHNCFYQIYIINADGSAEHKVVETEFAVHHPDWHPDGTRLSFDTEFNLQGDIYVVNADGSGLQLLIEDGFWADWSPDGTQLVFASKRDGNVELYVADADGSSQRRLTQNTRLDFFPAWSPDGRRIAFARLERKQIFVMNADGSDEQQLTHLGNAENPAWSPDGTRIAFQSSSEGNFEIYTIDAEEALQQGAGASPRRLTDNPAGDLWPSWGPATTTESASLPPMEESAPEGGGMVTGRIVFPSASNSQAGESVLDLFFENVATEEVTVLSLPTGQSTYAATVPTGSYVVYAWTPALAEKGAFTLCHPDEACEDHSLQTITVTAALPVTGVDITDWLPVENPSLVVAGTLIDGTGADPLADAAVVIREERIVAMGPRSSVQIPIDARVIDWPGITLLPGFINAHVHNTHSTYNRRNWAQDGVTTVRDVGSPTSLVEPFVTRDQLNAVPEYTRVLLSGPLVTVPEGYPTRQFPSLTVTSPEDARQKIDQLIDNGADVIKITMESGAGPILSLEEATAIVETAHARGIPVTVHATRLSDLIRALDAGVDDIAHMIREPAPDTVIQRMVGAGVTWVPTLEPFEGRDSGNLRRFIDAGGVVAMGNDSGYISGLEIGMPMDEIEYMHAARMTPMEIIVASTRNAAYVCDRLSILGTIEVGKYADVLIVDGDPLQDLQALKNVRLVVHSGVIIREEE